MRRAAAAPPGFTTQTGAQLRRCPRRRWSHASWLAAMTAKTQRSRLSKLLDRFHRLRTRRLQKELRMNTLAATFSQLRAPSAKTIVVSLLQTFAFGAILYAAALICASISEVVADQGGSCPDALPLGMDRTCTVLCNSHRHQAHRRCARRHI